MGQEEVADQRADQRMWHEAPEGAVRVELCGDGVDVFAKVEGDLSQRLGIAV